MNECNFFYDEYLDIFEIRKCGTFKHNIVDEKEGEFGIITHYDVDTNLIAITIPEPSVLFGVEKKDLKGFVNNIFT